MVNGPGSMDPTAAIGTRAHSMSRRFHQSPATENDVAAADWGWLDC